MARLLEDTAKEILREYQIAVPRFAVATTAEEAAAVAAGIGGPVVVKALVPVGKRGKAGAVKFGDSPEEAGSAAADLLGRTVRHYPVEKVLVEEKVAIARELYLSITFDASAKLPVILLSAYGGVDVEELVGVHRDKLYSVHVDPFTGLAEYQAREAWSELGLRGSELRTASAVAVNAYRAFAGYDAQILEINPLALTADGKAIAAAVLLGVDDDALYRHPNLAGKAEAGSDRAWRPLTALEKQIIAVDQADPYRGTARYTEMDGGDVAFFCGGGGGSLLMFDALLRNGGRPANYTEVGGNPTENKVYGLTKGILSKPGIKGLLRCGNISSNTQTNIVAAGMIRAIQELGIDLRTFPIVVRTAGVNEDQARELFAAAGIQYHGEDITMEDAARLMVDSLKAAYPDSGT